MLASEDKDSTSPVRVADFTSKIGQDIMEMKIALSPGLTIVKEPSSTQPNTWKLGAVEEVFHTLNTVLQLLTFPSEASLQRFPISAMVSVLKMLRTHIYVTVAKDLVMGSKSVTSLHQVTMPTTKKAGRSYPYYPRFRKSLVDYDLILGPVAWRICSRSSYVLGGSIPVNLLSTEFLPGYLLKVYQ